MLPFICILSLLHHVCFSYSKNISVMIFKKKALFRGCRIARELYTSSRRQHFGFPQPDYNILLLLNLTTKQYGAEL